MNDAGTMGRLAGRAVLVTGTSPNIGGGIAEALAAAGARVCAIDKDPDNASGCAQYLRDQGAQAVAAVADVTDPDQVDAAVRVALSAFGRVDALVNGAVLFGSGGVLDIDISQWRRQTDIILTGTLLMTRRTAEAMIEQGTGGSIVNIASTAAHQGEPGNIAYATAKSGILNFTRAAAMDLAVYQIRVNSLTPTSTDPSEATGRAARWGIRNREEPSAEVLAGFSKSRAKLPLGILPTPADYGGAVIFLLSDDSRLVTGTDLRVDAGALAKYWRIDAPPPQAANNTEKANADAPAGQ